MRKSDKETRRKKDTRKSWNKRKTAKRHCDLITRHGRTDSRAALCEKCAKFVHCDECLQRDRNQKRSNRIIVCVVWKAHFAGAFSSFSGWKKYLEIEKAKIKNTVQSHPVMSNILICVIAFWPFVQFSLSQSIEYQNSQVMVRSNKFHLPTICRNLAWINYIRIVVSWLLAGFIGQYLYASVMSIFVLWFLMLEIDAIQRRKTKPPNFTWTQICNWKTNIQRRK